MRGIQQCSYSETMPLSPDTVEMDFHQSNDNESASVKILVKLVFSEV